MVTKVKNVSEKTPAQLLADYGKVKLTDAANVAAAIGNVPTMGGIQQQMCMLMLAVGVTAKKEGLTDYDHKPVVQAFFDNYYGPGKGVGRTAKPESVDNYVSSYGRWLKAGLFAGWDAKPLALAATEATAITSLSGRAALIKSFMDDKARKVAPTVTEINAAIAKKTTTKTKTKSETAGEWIASGTVSGVRGASQAMAGDVNLQKFVKANGLQDSFDAMNSAMALFASAMELALASDKGKASEERIRKAAIAAAQKAQPAAGAKTN